MWLFFAEALTRSTASTLQSSQLISKVWFPRLLIPLAALSTPLLDFAASFTVLIIFLLAQGILPGWPSVALPVVVFLGLFTALGAGLWLSALAVRYRDVQIAVPFIVQLGLFATPVVYPLEVVPESAQPFYALNPMVGVLEGFRWALLTDAEAPGLLMLVSLVVSVVLVVHRCPVLHPGGEELCRCHLARRFASRSSPAWYSLEEERNARFASRPGAAWRASPVGFYASAGAEAAAGFGLCEMCRSR